MNTALTVDDLSLIERTYLGVLAMGLVPADLARDDRFRIEYLCAVCHAMRQDRPRTTYADGENQASAEFHGELREALIDLDRRRVIGIGTPRDLVILRPEAPPEAAYGSIDLNRHPPIFDRFLAQRCMDELLNLPPIYRLLMDLYAESGDIWGDLYEQDKQGYGDHR
ncbi:MAG: hypothetical protein ACYDCQ_12565 [Dehalococcoidia bacterium]